MNKKITLVSTILCGVAAVIWTIRAALDIAYETYHISLAFPVLNVLCAVTWIVAFFVNLHRYRSNKEE